MLGVASLLLPIEAGFLAGPTTSGPHRYAVRSSLLHMDGDFGLAKGQIYGPTNPAHRVEK